MARFVGLNLIIIAILILRKICWGKISRKMQYAMWIVVPLFMAVSLFVSIGSPIDLSFMVPEELIQAEEATIQKNTNEAPAAVENTGDLTKAHAGIGTAVQVPGQDQAIEGEAQALPVNSQFSEMDAQATQSEMLAKQTDAQALQIEEGAQSVTLADVLKWARIIRGL